MRFPLAVICFARVAMAAAPTCASLTNLFPTNARVTSADDVPAGAYVPASGAAPLKVPAFCRVRIIARPANDSEIHVELWLPAASAWNGKFEGTGNGGFSSAMSYGTMAAALNRGYAAAGSDTGHEGGEMTFGVGHPEKINDWAYRPLCPYPQAGEMERLGQHRRCREFRLRASLKSGGRDFSGPDWAADAK